MYSEQDLAAAIAAGAITQEAADSLRNHVSSGRAMPAVDEENFRLVNSFNDIFVAIAAIISLVAMAGIGGSIHDALGGFFVAATAWGLAEFFTLKRRMALPSIILLVAFVAGMVAGQIAMLEDVFGNDIGERTGALLIAGMAAITAFAAWLHWRRFMVPITIAAGTAAVAATAVALVLAALGIDPDRMEELVLTLVLIAGIMIFLIAMRWDISDRKRETRRSDVAFWLHLLAAPMIAHPLFYMVGITDGQSIGAAGALGVLGIYIAMGLVAIAVDRRALLVSALAYVLVALTFLFREFGVVELNVAITALVIGSGLLCLSAFWTPIRQFVVAKLPGDLQTKLPVTHLASA